MLARSATALIYVRSGVNTILRDLLRSDSVRNFIWLYYAWFIAGSIHLTFFSYPIKLIVGPMGMGLYDAWAWMPLIAAPVALLGLALRHGGSSVSEIEIHDRLLRRDFAGLYMQVGGHACMTIVLAVFIGTGWYGREPGQPVPSVFWLSAYLMGVGFLTAQCLYKIKLGKAKRS